MKKASDAKSMKTMYGFLLKIVVVIFISYGFFLKHNILKYSCIFILSHFILVFPHLICEGYGHILLLMKALMIT